MPTPFPYLHRYVHESEAEAEAAERGVSGRYVVARNPEEASEAAKAKHGQVSSVKRVHV